MLDKITQSEINANNVKSADDEPTGTAEEVKGLFDKLPELIASKYNGLLDKLTSKVDGSSGADEIGSTALKLNGATSVQGQLKELYTDKVDKIAGKGLSTNDFTNEDVQSLANKVDKITGKGLSTNDYTTEEKEKLKGIESNANNYSLPVASGSVLGGIKIGTGMEIHPDGTVNATAAPAPDLPCRAQLAQEIQDRANADTILTNRIATEEQTRTNVDNNLQVQISANKNAVNVDISESLRVLYGLSVDNANVEKALEKAKPVAHIIAITNSQNWTPPAGVTEVEVFIMGAGGGGSRYQGGGAGYALKFKYRVTPGVPISIVIGVGGAHLQVGGYTSFDRLKAIGGNPGIDDNVPQNVNGSSSGGHHYYNGSVYVQGIQDGEEGTGIVHRGDSTFCDINSTPYGGGGGAPYNPNDSAHPLGLGGFPNGGNGDTIIGGTGSNAGIGGGGGGGTVAGTGGNGICVIKYFI